MIIVAVVSLLSLFEDCSKAAETEVGTFLLLARECLHVFLIENLI